MFKSVDYLQYHTGFTPGLKCDLYLNLLYLNENTYLCKVKSECIVIGMRLDQSGNTLFFVGLCLLCGQAHIVIGSQPDVNVFVHRHKKKLAQQVKRSLSSDL